MARIIRTTPKNRKIISLRVVFSFLLFMQIQMPDAREMKAGQVMDLSFRLATQAAPQVTAAQPQTLTAGTCCLPAKSR